MRGLLEPVLGKRKPPHPETERGGLETWRKSDEFKGGLI